MKPRVIILVIFTVSACGLQAQLSKFGKPAPATDINTLYEYRKSNWDGKHSSTIFLYVAEHNKLESFKWNEGDEEATLVSAVVDWETYSVSEFQNHKIRKGKVPEFVARLKGEKNLKIEVGGLRDSLLITDLPWQSYDFDFAGLGFIWRALKNKRDNFWFHRADVAVVNDQPKFVNKGKVTITFQGIEMLNSKPCFKYLADGDGLEHRGGHIWINQETFMIEKYKIALPDEPGFENGMLQLIKTHKMSSNEWQDFKRKKLGE